MARTHFGKKDKVTKAIRSKNMRAIQSKGTKPEEIVAAWLRRARIRVERNANDLPGRPDFLKRRAGTALLVHGDFWHGWQYSRWKDRLPREYWRSKIEKNRERDKKNRRKLRSMGFKVLVIWEHQIHGSPLETRSRVLKFLASKT
jgi:DNA mismatch endonuclease (patch repair protein)